MKTASRIVGSAAFHQNYFAQDSPVYGAERRGAPVAAFTRFGEAPILERGIVTAPDLVVIADESLLSDPLVRPLAGLSASGMLLINSMHPAQDIREAQRLASNIVAHDFTALAISHTGSTASLSVALGAAAAQIAGLDRRNVETAVRSELAALRVPPPALTRNIALAAAALKAVGATPPVFSGDGAGDGRLVVTPSYRGPWAGTASVAARPNTPLRKTGDWRVSRPLIDLDRCTHCWICFVNCPDGAISLTADDIPEIDYAVCKGCLLCVEECPVHTIESVREAEAR